MRIRLLKPFVMSALAIAAVACEQTRRAAEAEPPPPAQLAGGRTMWALSNFPYGPTDEHKATTHRIAAENSELHVVQLDYGVPWAEALRDEPPPAPMRQRWEDQRERAPTGRPVYLALEPLDEDRERLAPATEGSSVPEAIRGAAFDSDPVKTAYLNYARRAVEYFEPTYLNLGVENGELAQRRPGAWPAYVRLFRHVAAGVRKQRPEIKIGISFGLQSLMEPATAERARPLLRDCDYLGLSFYPYMSNFHEKYGVSPLPSPPQEWRRPLEWVRQFTDKPIAICETGYNTADVSLPEWGVSMHGSEALQAQYLRELAGYAGRDEYPFVVYYLPIDIGPLLDSLPAERRGAADMWRHNGLLDADLNPKPAWRLWRDILADQPPGENEPQDSDQQDSDRSSAPAAFRIGFDNREDLFRAPDSGQIRLVGAENARGEAMRWTYQRPRRGQFAWIARTIEPGALAETDGFTFRARSDQTGPLVLRVKERDGETFFFEFKTELRWRTFSLPWPEFTLERKTRKDGRLEPRRLSELVLAETGGESEGRRHVWITDWIAR